MSAYIYIDGAYLRERLKAYSERYCNGVPFLLDYARYFESYEKKFYYDCLPPQGADEDDGAYRERSRLVGDHFNTLRSLPGFHVFQGRTSGVGNRARQKGVDVQLSVHMLTHAFRKIVRHVTLLAGDGDFKPLAEAVVAEGSYLTLLSDKRNTSTELIYAVDMYTPIVPFRMLDFATPEFKRAFPPAQISNTQRKKIPDGLQPTQVWEGDVELFRLENRGLLTFPSRSDPNYITHIYWHDLELLRRIVQDGILSS